MEEKVVMLFKDEPRVATFNIYKKIGYYEHRILKRVIVDNIEILNEFGLMPLEVLQPPKGSKGGRPEKSYLLNEDQFLMLITLCRNFPDIIKLKVKIVKQFITMRKMLSNLASQRSNSAWLEKREETKIGRIQETDTIKKFVEYAKEQGSKSAETYYMNISKMENKALFFIEQKFKNLRDQMNFYQLSTIIDADAIVDKAICDGMEQKLDYHDIYQLAKKRIEMFSEIRGKSLIPVIFKRIE